MPLQIPHPTTALHLYRHLLREASYLLPLCRPWITSRVQARFRECRNKKDPGRYVKEAHQRLRYLRSANSGHLERILHLCYLATGRVGKRRRVLATSQLARHPAKDTVELRAKNNAVSDRDAREPDWLDNWSLDTIRALGESQTTHQGNSWPQNMRRLVNPKLAIPKENSFGRPLSRKLARNKLKRHWKSVLAQLLPPLPQGERDRLAALAEGDVGMEELRLPPRRPVAQPVSDHPAASARSDWARFVSSPARLIERGNSRRMKTLTGEEDRDPRGHGRPIGTRVFRPQKVRRAIYGPVLAATPVMEKNPESGHWSVTWGKAEQKIPSPLSRHLQFFQGVSARSTSEDSNRSTRSRSAGRPPKNESRLAS